MKKAEEDEDDDSVSGDDEYDQQIHLNWLKENLKEAKEKKTNYGRIFYA